MCVSLERVRPLDHGDNSSLDFSACTPLVVSQHYPSEHCLPLPPRALLTLPTSCLWALQFFIVTVPFQALQSSCTLAFEYSRVKISEFAAVSLQSAPPTGSP